MDLSLAKHQMEPFIREALGEGEQALTLIVERVSSLDDLLKSGKFDAAMEAMVPGQNGIKMPKQTVGAGDSSMNQANSAESDSGSKKPYILPGAVFPVNQILVDLFDEVKPLVQELAEDADKIGTWIALLMPTIEDGNNFGAEVQEMTRDQMDEFWNTAQAHTSLIHSYWDQRSKLLTEAIKYPQVEDTLTDIRELDKTAVFTARKSVQTTKEFYLNMQQIVTKNLDMLIGEEHGNSHGMF